MPILTTCTSTAHHQKATISTFVQSLPVYRTKTFSSNPLSLLLELSTSGVFGTPCWLHQHQATHTRAKSRLSATFPRTPSTSYVSFLGQLTFTTALFLTVPPTWCPLTVCSPPLSTATPLNWSPAAEPAFTQIKDALTDLSLFVHLKPDAPTCIVTDASVTAVGAVLQQRIGEDWSLIAFFSKKLQPSETCYSAFNCELLAVYLTINHLRHFVEGCSFHILTDHKPLPYDLQKNYDRLSPLEIRHLDYISQFKSDISHI